MRPYYLTDDAFYDSQPDDLDSMRKNRRTKMKSEKNKTRGTVKVHGCLGIYFSVVSFGRARLYGETCKCRKTANRQARKIAQRLGLEVVK